MAQGIIKSYDPNTGLGIVLDEETREDLVLDSESMKQSIFVKIFLIINNQTT